MISRKYLPIALLALVVPTLSVAQERQGEMDMAGMVTLSMPFDSARQTTGPSLGFQLRYQRDAADVMLQPRSFATPALLDVRLNRTGLVGLNSYGVSMMPEHLRLNADGGGLGAIGWIGLLLAGVVGWAIIDADGGSGGSLDEEEPAQAMNQT